MNNKSSLPNLLLACLIGLFAAAIWPIMSAAQTDQTNTAVPEALGPEAISELVSKMDPEQTEALSNLVGLLSSSISDELADTKATNTEIASTFENWIIGFGDNLVSQVMRIPDVMMGIWRGIGSFFASRDSGSTLVFLLLTALVIVVGLAVEKLFDRAFTEKREKIRSTTPKSLLETLKLLSTRALIEIGDVAVFAIAALITARVIFSSPEDLFIVNTLILKAILIYRMVAAVLKFILAPVRTDLRLVSTDDWTARYTYRQYSAIAGFIGIAFFMVAIFERNGIEFVGALRFWVSVTANLWIIGVTWKARKGLTSIILGDETSLTPGLERMAVWWPPISIAIIAINWLLTQFILSTGYEGLTAARGSMSILLIVMMPFLDTIVRGIATHLVPTVKGRGVAAEKVFRATQYSYVRIGRVVLLCFLVLVIFKLWGLDVRNLAQAGLGTQIASHFIGFLFILALGYAAWEIANVIINRKLAREMEASGMGEESEGGEGGGAGLTRMATILPILRYTLQATIITLTLLLALDQIGVDTTPLLAGAGVLGLAIGFGAQTLVKDIVSGVFFLLDDAFRAGEFIDIGGTSGTVEKISVRSMHLRGVKGPIHVVPYGSISKLTNHSRDWVIMKLKFTIPFDTDLEKVRKLFKKIGQEMMEDPELADKFLSPFKGQGAADVTDVGIVIRGKFTTRPGDQWVIRKEVYNRVQRAFEENGLEFARKEVRVQLADNTDHSELTPDQKKVIAGAASDAAESASGNQPGPVDDR